MDARHLSVFLAVAEELNFTRGAARLRTAQSAVSATVRSLEKELGDDLFDRTSRQIALTPAGMALVAPAQRVLDALRDARDAVDAVKGRVTGGLRLGVMTSVKIVDVAELLGRYARCYPDVCVQMHPSPTGAAGTTDRLLAGELDVAFIANVDTEGTELQASLLAVSPLLLAVPVDHPIATHESVSLDEVADNIFIDTPFGYANRKCVDQAFARAGLAREVRFETSDISDITDLVQHGLGLAFVPEVALSGRPRLRGLPVRGEILELAISLVVHGARPISRAAEALRRMASAERTTSPTPRSALAGPPLGGTSR
jgi:DNA-binding transcriptional LysR family regulator